MKIAITAGGKDLNSMLDERFGRCKYFIFADSETMEFKALDNTYSDSAHGVGVQVAQFVIDQGVDSLITGNLGPNAAKVLSESGITIYNAGSMTVNQAIDLYKQGKLTKMSGPTTNPHK